MTKIAISLIAVSFVALACQKQNEPVDLNAWNRSESPVITLSDGTAVKAEYLLDCRMSTDSANMKYYYTVIGEEGGFKETALSNGDKETIYNLPRLIIENVVVEGDNAKDATIKRRRVFQVPVDYKKLVKTDGNTTLNASASAATVEKAVSYKSSPYFKSIQLGQAIMTLRLTNSRLVNTTEMDLPGLTNGDVLECR